MTRAAHVCRCSFTDIRLTSAASESLNAVQFQGKKTVIPNLLMWRTMLTFCQHVYTRKYWIQDKMCTENIWKPFDVVYKAQNREKNNTGKQSRKSHVPLDKPFRDKSSIIKSDKSTYLILNMQKTSVLEICWQSPHPLNMSALLWKRQKRSQNFKHRSYFTHLWHTDTPHGLRPTWNQTWMSLM